jgi:hypothetical protein
LPALKADKLTTICETIVKRKCWTLDVSQLNGPSWPVTGIFLSFLVVSLSFCLFSEKNSLIYLPNLCVLFRDVLMVSWHYYLMFQRNTRTLCSMYTGLCSKTLSAFIVTRIIPTSMRFCWTLSILNFLHSSQLSSEIEVLHINYW